MSNLAHEAYCKESYDDRYDSGGSWLATLILVCEAGAQSLMKLRGPSELLVGIWLVPSFFGACGLLCSVKFA